MSIKEYLGEWIQILGEAEVLKISKWLKGINNTSPSPAFVFTPFHYCPYDKLKVIFIGEGPYPNNEIANGLLFGSKSKDIPNALKIIKDALFSFDTINNSSIFDYSLKNWANQGVLLLNTALTCEINKPNSHDKIWDSFIKNLLLKLSERETGLIYVLFGEKAQSLRLYIDPRYNEVIITPHPYDYYNSNTPMSYDLFKRINNLLIYKYNTQINFKI